LSRLTIKFCFRSFSYVFAISAKPAGIHNCSLQAGRDKQLIAYQLRQTDCKRVLNTPRGLVGCGGVAGRGDAASRCHGQRMTSLMTHDFAGKKTRRQRAGAAG